MTLVNMSLQIDDQPCDGADTLCGYKVIFTLLQLLGLTVVSVP